MHFVSTVDDIYQLSGDQFLNDSRSFFLRKTEVECHVFDRRYDPARVIVTGEAENVDPILERR